MPSAAPLAALLRRRAWAGGGVARGWGLVDDGSGRCASGAAAAAAASKSEADRLTVTTDDDEMEPLRDDLRPWAWCGSTSLWEFIVSFFGGTQTCVGCVSQAKPAVNAMRMQAWLPKQERAQAGRAAMQWSVGGGRWAGWQQGEWAGKQRTGWVVGGLGVVLCCACNL